VSGVEGAALDKGTAREGTGQGEGQATGPGLAQRSETADGRVHDSGAIGGDVKREKSVLNQEWPGEVERTTKRHVAGAGLGASAQAALVTRGFVELRRVGVALGAQPETLMGLAGLGDLILTCSSAQSRNFAYGMALGSGESLEGRPLAEGVATAGIAARIAHENGVEAPIIAAVEALLAGKITIADAVAALMARPLKSEFET